MNNILVVFANRNHTMQFASYMRKLAINSKIINTPRDITKACGISIVIDKKNIDMVKTILNRFQFSSLVGVYEIVDNGIFRNYRRI